MDENLLKKTFLAHLNYIYIGKKHLVNFFTEVLGLATLNVLKLAIDEAIEDTRNQINHIEAVYASIKEEPSETNTLGIKAITLEAYLEVIKAGKSPLERDVFILFYLQQIEGIEVTYFKVLKNLGKAVGYETAYLDQPYDTAVENKVLFESIYKEYIS